jgi:hypothetical protein
VLGVRLEASDDDDVKCAQQPETLEATIRGAAAFVEDRSEVVVGGARVARPRDQRRGENSMGASWSTALVRMSSGRKVAPCLQRCDSGRGRPCTPTEEWLASEFEEQQEGREGRRC